MFGAGGKLLVGVLILCALAAMSWAGPVEDLGPWCAVVRQAGAWVAAPDLPAEAEISCHLYGAGRFRVLFRQGETQRRYTLELPVANWYSFKRQLAAGPLEIFVEPLPDARNADPQLTGLVATTNPDYQPDLVDLQHPLFARVTNLAEGSAAVRLAVACQHPQRYYSVPGYLTATGFAPNGSLAAGEKSLLLNWSRVVYGRSVLSFQPAGVDTNVEIRLFTDAAGTRELKTLRLQGKSVRTLIVYPQQDGLRAITTDELFTTRLEELKTALRDDPRPVPKRAYVNASLGDTGEALDTFRNELALVRLAGADSTGPLGRLEPERKELGFTSCWAMDFIPIAPGWQFDGRAAEEYVTAHQRQLPRGGRGIIILSDEPMFNEIAKGAELDKRFVAWLQAKGLAPADAGVAGWGDVHCIAPTEKQPRLSVLSRDFQREQEISYWDGFGQVFTTVNPELDPAVNFAVGGYYDGEDLDLWELYRRPGLDVVWGEDWHGYMPLGIGAIAWYADLMRSQAKYRHLPTGTYPILGYGYSPALDTMRYYERFMRGCWNYDLYPYSPRGNEVSWLDNPQVTLNIARRHRDLAEVEDILVDGAVLPARVALLYPRSCELWDRSAFADVFALYVALLHSGVAVDILTEQDLVDGLGKDYGLIYCTGANIRRDALAVLDGFITSGGAVAFAGPPLRDRFNEPIPGAAEIAGVKTAEPIADVNPGRFAYEFAGAKPLDTVRFDGKEMLIYCQQARLTPADGAKVLATFADGSPALLKTARGKGLVYLYAFSPGLSYLKAEYGDNSGFATGVLRNEAARAICALPTEALPRTVTCSAPLVSSRVVASPAGAVVGLIDYGLGAVGRGTTNLKQSSVDLETMPPYPVTVRIACKTKPAAVRAIRAGQVRWSYAAGVLTVEVPLRGADMLKLDGAGLF